MASRQALEVGIRIGATNDTQNAINGALSGFRGLANGLVTTGIGYRGLSMLKDVSDTYAAQQFSFANLRIMEMNNRGKVNEEVYGREEQYIRGLSGIYAKSTEDYTKMAIILRQNRIGPEDLMGGIGETSAKLAKVFDNMEPDKAALLFARLKNDMAVSVKDMDRLADMTFRMKNLGVGENAEDAVHQITMFYARASLGARVLGMQGAKDAEDLGKLGAVFMTKGFKGQIVGTSFSKIFDGLRDTERQGKVKAAAALFGIDMQFFDKSGAFMGIQNFNNQLAKTANLSTQARASIFKAFSTKQGLTTEEVEYLAKYSGEIKEINRQYDGLAHLTDAVGELIKTLQIQNDKTESAKKNMKAAFGKATVEDVQLLNRFLQGTYKALEDIATENPKMAGIAQEWGALALTMTGLIGGLRTLASLNPTFGAIAAGLTKAFGPILIAAAALELMNLAYSNAESQRSEPTNDLVSEKSLGKYDRNIGFFDKKIEDNKAEGNNWGPETMLWRLRGLEHSAAFMFQPGIYNMTHSDYGQREEQGFMKYYLNTASPEEIAAQYRHPVTGNGVKDYNFGWKQTGQFPGTSAPMSASAKAPVTNNTATITYAPQITLAGGMSKEDIDSILKNNSDVLLQTMLRAQQRDKNTSYGSK